MREYRIYLTEHGKPRVTIQKYIRELVWFLSFLQGEEPAEAKVLERREQLQQSHQARTVNTKLSTIHSYLDYLGLTAYKVGFLKIQHTVFVDDSRDLAETEYHRLLDATKRKRDSRLYHVMLATCTTGIRISELSFLTVEALHRGKAEIRMRGRIRTILLTRGLCQELNTYAKEKGTRARYLFYTRTGKPLDRSNICHDIKKLYRTARVNPEKVFPHDLRHLFAKYYYAIKKNLAYLANIPGHASVDTTRIYVAMGTRERERTLQQIHLTSQHHGVVILQFHGPLARLQAELISPIISVSKQIFDHLLHIEQQNRYEEWTYTTRYVRRSTFYACQSALS